MKNEASINLHENDITLLQKEKKLILKRVAVIEKEILMLSKYNRQIIGRDNDGYGSKIQSSETT